MLRKRKEILHLHALLYLYNFGFGIDSHVSSLYLNQYLTSIREALFIRKEIFFRDLQARSHECTTLELHSMLK